MNKKLIFRFAVIIVIILETFPVIQGYFNVPNYALMFLVFGFAIFYYPKSFLNRGSYYLIIFAIIISINLWLKPAYEVSWYRTIIVYWIFSFSIINVLIYNNDWKGLKLITITFIIILMLTVILTIPLAVIDPDLVRNMVVNASLGKIEEIKASQRLGVINYGSIHAIPTLLPVLIYTIKTSIDWKKILYIFFTVVLYYIIIKSSFATALILSTAIIGISLFITENKNKNITYVIIFLLIVFPLLNMDILLNSLDNVKPYFNNSAVYDKITDIQFSIKFDKVEGQLSDRNDLYINSWNTFFQHPIWGTNDPLAAGGHAFIADFLAWFGLLGTIPLLLFFFNTFKRTYFLIQGNQKIYYIISLIPFIILCFVKGTPFFEQILYIFVFIPSIFLIKKKKRLEVYSKSNR